MFSLDGMNALVTGASGGIGQSIAVALAKQGAEVVISGTRANALEETAKVINDACGKVAHIITCNLKDSAEVDTLFDKSEALVGKIDILINNAGITRDGLAMRMKDEDWQEVIDINLTSSFRLCRAAIKAMMRRRYGRIINISSIVGTMGNAGQANYCASKAGLIGMSKALAFETASRGITINCISPGFIETPMTHNLPEAVKNKMLTHIPSGAYGKPDDIAAACAYLASKASAYVTGQTLHINGGMLMV